jgi:hypothetical protein
MAPRSNWILRRLIASLCTGDLMIATISGFLAWMITVSLRVAIGSAIVPTPAPITSVPSLVQADHLPYLANGQ